MELTMHFIYFTVAQQIGLSRVQVTVSWAPEISNIPRVFWAYIWN